MTRNPASPRRVGRWERWSGLTVGVVMLLAGIALAVGGIRLLWLGGPVYHALAGVALIVSGGLLIKARRSGLWAYLALFAVTLLWAPLRVGVDGFALIPWLLAPMVLLMLVMLVAATMRAWRATITGAGLVLTAIALAAVGFRSASAPLVFSPSAVPQGSGEWAAYGGAPGGGQFQPASGITPANVGQLRRAWTFHTGERGDGLFGLTFEANPLVAGNRLYVTTATAKVAALDPASGRVLWRFDAQVPRSQPHGIFALRGVSLWRGGGGGACAERIFLGTIDARLIALDAATGEMCRDFGSGGQVQLRDGLRMRDPAGYYTNSPPAIVGNVVVVGSTVGDNYAAAVERGVVRGYDVRTGQLRWSWDPIPHDAVAARALGWRLDHARATGAANAWAPLSADPARGLVFVPTGSASPDYWGGRRAGDDRHANSVVALRVSDGSVAWARQLVHHDLWDHDVAMQPALATVRIRGRLRDVVIVAPKGGFLFVLDRDTGKPLYPVLERRVPQSDVLGESASLTQPFPPSAFRLARHGALRAGDAWGVTPIDQMLCAIRMAPLRSEGIYTPPSAQGSIVYPGYGGGLNWGGVSVDPGSGLVIGAVMDIAMVSTVLPRQAWKAQRDGGKHAGSEFGEMAGTPFGMRREPLVSPLGAPCSPPPWGRLTAVDLGSGRVAWNRPLGTTAGLAPVALPLGSPVIGGPATSAGGVTFVAATLDGRFRAFDTRTGRLLWEDTLPAAANATPALYRLGRRDFVVVAAGGGGFGGSKPSDALVAYALPPQ